MFQLTAARRRLDIRGSGTVEQDAFQLTAARRRLVAVASLPYAACDISTHSRAKAAGTSIARIQPALSNFNSQPREGGWTCIYTPFPTGRHFNSQPREGGWDINALPSFVRPSFQLTAARRRLGSRFCRAFASYRISTHSRAKAAGLRGWRGGGAAWYFNSQPREGGWFRP